MTASTAPAPRSVRRLGDRVFSGAALTGGLIILVALAAVAIFLVAQSIPAIGASSTDIESSGAYPNFWAYVGPLVFGTIWAALLALLFAVPFSIAIALFISHYAPRRIARALGAVIDLLAAIPSVVYGAWGIFVFAPFVQPFYAFLGSTLGWFPLFAGPVSPTGRTILTAALVLAVMVIPIVTSLSREIFLQTPRLNEEAALALGATRWEMIRMAVLPFGRSGIVAASMLGLGRALGETFAVALVLSPSVIVSAFLLKSENPTTIAANIALQFPDSYGLSVNVLIATGLILFVITFVVNAASRAIVGRRGGGKGI
ncbi:phosphate ABC transporter permease subunit PstC [Amnibacterium setariae]|uniref:Phosphate transport system permease protein n=1 Tax=Amnibacterium setariae TaxID=2306585 RepID=A0A3A1U0N8_9MICO|nr:phosphate ABC transporter permease subunit PstC [Amnibacterium setariae]RIX30485.1 phosphate ABC transporter permease subunit PstC [Amnibacterium setariae]